MSSLKGSAVLLGATGFSFRQGARIATAICHKSSDQIPAVIAATDNFGTCDFGSQLDFPTNGR